jgi:nitrite reductase/ring-hydroxylating ferredoxin subunit
MFRLLFLPRREVRPGLHPAKALDRKLRSVYCIQMMSSSVQPLPDQSALTRLCKASEVPDQGVRQVVPPGSTAEYAVYKLDGEYFVTDDMCTHGMVSLSNGDVEDGQIICPLHGGAFDIRTGKATELPCRLALKIYRAEVIGADVYADLGGA